MTFSALNPPPPRKIAGFTLVEMLVALGLGLVVSAIAASLSVYSAQTFSAMSNYVDLDLHSRNALDVIGRELRQATAVIDWKTNSNSQWVTLTNSDAGKTIKVTWRRNSATLVMEKTGESDKTFLTGCDDWQVSIFTRAPNVSSTNLSFNAAPDLPSAKLINMSWKCSRTILGSKLNTESVQTAQIVLRNKVR
jgi:prepilin-type N-terminal cleavage/methylation domain-containing protein